MQSKQQTKEIPISYEALNAIREIIWMARRYADGRATYAPSMFNNAYDVLRTQLGNVLDVNKDTICSAFPYAVDARFDVVSHRPYKNNE